MQHTNGDSTISVSDLFDGYEDLLSKQSGEARSYDIGSKNWLAGRTLLSSTETLKYAVDYAQENAGNYTTDREKLQYFQVRRVVHHFDAAFHLIRQGLYNPSRSQIRFLLETYLSLKALNDDKDRAAEIWDDTRSQLHEMDIDSDSIVGERLRSITPIWKMVKDEREELTDIEETLLWDHTSNAAVHPYSIEDTEIDNEYNEEIEGNLLDMANAFAFGISSQFMKTWEGTDVYWGLLRVLDSLVVRVRLATGRVPPPMFDDELDVWFAGVKRSKAIYGR